MAPAESQPTQSLSVVTPNLLAKVVSLSPDRIATQDSSEALFVMSKHWDKLNALSVSSEELSCKITNFHPRLFFFLLGIVLVVVDVCKLTYVVLLDCHGEQHCVFAYAFSIRRKLGVKFVFLF